MGYVLDTDKIKTFENILFKDVISNIGEKCFVGNALSDVIFKMVGGSRVSEFAGVVQNDNGCIFKIYGNTTKYKYIVFVKDLINNEKTMVAFENVTEFIEKCFFLKPYSICIREKKNHKRIKVLSYGGWYDDDGEINVILGCYKFTLSELFNDYEYLANYDCDEPERWETIGKEK